MPMIIVLMGVSGSGKTVVGQELARQLGWKFIDADDYHPAANIAKMRQGIPLNDDDRRPWLEAMRRLIDEAARRGENIVLACSALKHAYQKYLEGHAPVHFVWLTGPEELIAQRLATRKGHFMNPKLLHSQFETLEPPEHALQVDITPRPPEIAAEIRRRLNF
jgi:gluconokinase